MSRYYISTGAYNNFYTLRQTWRELTYSRDAIGNSHATGEVTRDFHVRNLSTDRDTAIAKAKDLTGRDLSTDIEVVPMGTPREIDWSILQAGKYAGRSIHELAEQTDGRQYLIWLAENCAGNGRYAKTVELARSFLAHELAERSEARAAAQASLEKVQAEVRALLAREIEVLEDGNAWCMEAASGLGKRTLHPNFGAIIADIYGRAFGRRNSKAYKAAVESSEGRIEQANAILATVGI